MRDPELVARAQHAAARLETAWERWRSLQGLATTPAQPVVGYVGYALKEPWGQPRAVIGFSADEAERLAEFLEHDNADGQQAPQAQAVAAQQMLSLSLPGPIQQRSATGPMVMLPPSGPQPTFTPQPSFSPQESTQPSAAPPPAGQRQAAERQAVAPQAVAPQAVVTPPVAPPPVAPQPRAGRPSSSKHAQPRGRSARSQETETDKAGGGRTGPGRSRAGQGAGAAASPGVPAQAAAETLSAAGAADSAPLADLGAEGS